MKYKPTPESQSRLRRESLISDVGEPFGSLLPSVNGKRRSRTPDRSIVISVHHSFDGLSRTGKPKQDPR